MSTADKPRALLAIAYAEYAEAYLRSLPLEHFMEAPAQATQRKITLESLDLVHARRPDVQVFNELLVQYARGRQRKPRQVVPDNMVVVWKEPIKADGSYGRPLAARGSVLGRFTCRDRPSGITSPSRRWWPGRSSRRRS